MKKKTLVNIGLEDDEVEQLDAMAGKALNRQAVARMLLIAGLEAVKRSRGKIHLPPRFEIPDDAASDAAYLIMNEPKGPIKRGQ